MANSGGDGALKGEIFVFGVICRCGLACFYVTILKENLHYLKKRRQEEDYGVNSDEDSHM